MVASATTASSSALFAHLGRITRESAERALAPYGLRPRHLVTLTVLEEYGDETQQALAAAVRIDRTNLVGLLNELEEAGLLLRTRDAADRRRHIVSITEQGSRTLEAVRGALAETEDELLDVLDASERAVLHDMLLRISASFVSDCAMPAELAACAEAAADENCPDAA